MGTLPPEPRGACQARWKDGWEAVVCLLRGGGPPCPAVCSQEFAGVVDVLWIVVGLTPAPGAQVSSQASQASRHWLLSALTWWHVLQDTRSSAVQIKLWKRSGGGCPLW